MDSWQSSTRRHLSQILSFMLALYWCTSRCYSDRYRCTRGNKKWRILRKETVIELDAAENTRIPQHGCRVMNAPTLPPFRTKQKLISSQTSTRRRFTALTWTADLNLLLTPKNWSTFVVLNEKNAISGQTFIKFPITMDFGWRYRVEKVCSACRHRIMNRSVTLKWHTKH